MLPVSGLASTGLGRVIISSPLHTCGGRHACRIRLSLAAKRRRGNSRARPHKLEPTTPVPHRCQSIAVAGAAKPLPRLPSAQSSNHAVTGADRTRLGRYRQSRSPLLPATTPLPPPPSGQGG